MAGPSNFEHRQAWIRWHIRSLCVSALQHPPLQGDRGCDRPGLVHHGSCDATDPCNTIFLQQLARPAQLQLRLSICAMNSSPSFVSSGILGMNAMFSVRMIAWHGPRLIHKILVVRQLSNLAFNFGRRIGSSRIERPSGQLVQGDARSKDSRPSTWRLYLLCAVGNALK